MAKLLRKQGSVEDLVQDLAALVAQDNLATDERGDLSILTTFNKTDLVHAVNEINAEADVNRDLLDIINELIGGELTEGVFDYDALDTISNSIIKAINENKAGVDSSLKKSDNLSDVTNVVQSRANLNVYSTTEVEGLIAQSEINLGSNFSVDDITDRNSLQDLTVGDNVFVRDNGDGKWAIYKVVELSGIDPVFESIMDEDVYLNSISASAIKSSYESNSDTNAYTDVDSTKVQQISVTSAIDLDKVVQNDELNTDSNLITVTDTDIASSLAIKTFINNKTLRIVNNLSDIDDKSIARTNLDVYSKQETAYLVQNIDFGDIDLGDMVNVVRDMEKAKKNYFFGLEILGSLK